MKKVCRFLSSRQVSLDWQMNVCLNQNITFMNMKIIITILNLKERRLPTDKKVEGWWRTDNDDDHRISSLQIYLHHGIIYSSSAFTGLDWNHGLWSSSVDVNERVDYRYRN